MLISTWRGACLVAAAVKPKRKRRNDPVAFKPSEIIIFGGLVFVKVL